jgi:RNA polymerase sigma-70 factor (sigma-E family)
MRDDATFRAFVEEFGSTLLHAARLLTADHHSAEDLVQVALIKVYQKWGRIDAPLAYARRALVTSQIDSRRRRWWGERPSDGDELAAVVSEDEQITAWHERDALRHLLDQLSVRERAVIVLRYYFDLTERETAETLDVPVGTVKSTNARALARLRVAATTNTSVGEKS